MTNIMKKQHFKEVTKSTLSNEVQFVQLIEAFVPELEKMTFTDNDSSILSNYHKILLAYYRKDLVQLTNFIQSLKYSQSNTYSQDEFEILKRISQLRLAIRKNKISANCIETLLNLQNSCSVRIWKKWEGEIFGIVAFALSEIAEFEKSKKYYEMSIIAFGEVGAIRKKIRAMHNYVAIVSNIDNKKCLIKEYLFIYKQAYKQKSYDLAGMALANVAREYQILGLLQNANRYSQKAVVFAASNPQTVHYDLIHLYRAHILIDLNQEASAKEIIDQCKLSPYNEIQGGLLILESILEKKKPSSLNLSSKIRLLPGWKERLLKASQKNKKKIEPTPLEEKFIYFVSTKDRTKNEIITYLYGDRIDLEYTQNRFFVLLDRITKKWPHLIERNLENCYSIA